MNQSRLAQPIDKLAIILIVLLTFIMGLLVWGGTACEDECLFHAGARVSNFSWENKTVGGQDRAFILTFNRPMDRLSVEKNLSITPPLPGKISWSGLRLAYTLNDPITYGETYQVTLAGARDRFSHQEQAGEEIKPFNAEFYSRDRALAYIGTKGEEQGRLVLSNWTSQQTAILTPKNLAVFDFKPDPQGNFLLFSAADTSQGVEGIRYLKLYTVTTQLNASSKITPKIKLVLDNQKYQNNKFDISQDGKIIVVQRLNRNNPRDYGLWKIVDGQSPQLITNAQVGDFLITPDSQAVAVAQGEGIALLPLKAQAQALDFLPKFGQVLDFTADGTGAAMINYNTDSEKLKYTRSLYYVNNQVIQKKLLNTDGSIQNCQFDPTAKHLYCWLTELAKGEVYVEKPYLAEINLKTGKINTLVTVPNYQESQVSVAPDGLGILFERSLRGNSVNVPGNQKNSIWLAIPAANLADTNTPSIEQLPFIGFHPQWLP
ncbi:Ig-like domain-containing protein [Pleurocapsa sp. PCC 7319]|uniref:Ig-like domain-containing protein n=1 Tax=Pleurocapsa sp. PCC 7319 TaxID=118161 RepID=UPI000346F326|nr:Ig-like domain-containing protein [Pleurocapsa sp. PCC 7319]